MIAPIHERHGVMKLLNVTRGMKLPPLFGYRTKNIPTPCVNQQPLWRQTHGDGVAIVVLYWSFHADGENS